MRRAIFVLTLVGSAVSAVTAATEVGERKSSYTVGPGDVLEVTLRGEKHLTTVQRDGSISISTVKLKVKGLTVSEVRQELRSSLSRADSPADLAVRVKEHRSRFAFVTGEVLRPGRFFLSGDETVASLLFGAGGFTSSASGEIIVRRAAGGQDLRILLTPDMTVKEQRRALDIAIGQGDVVSVSRVASTPEM